MGGSRPALESVVTRLYKCDGVGNRLLTAREFRQVAGRAGREALLDALLLAGADLP